MACGITVTDLCFVLPSVNPNAECGMTFHHVREFRSAHGSRMPAIVETSSMRLYTLLADLVVSMCRNSSAVHAVRSLFGSHLSTARNNVRQVRDFDEQRCFPFSHKVAERHIRFVGGFSATGESGGDSVQLDDFRQGVQCHSGNRAERQQQGAHNMRQ